VCLAKSSLELPGPLVNPIVNQQVWLRHCLQRGGEQVYVLVPKGMKSNEGVCLHHAEYGLIPLTKEWKYARQSNWTVQARN